jgi:uncharacterized membrane protein
MHKPEEIASRLMGSTYQALNERARNVARHVAGRKNIARNVAESFEATTLGQSAADHVASFGGSWTFVGLFTATIIASTPSTTTR